MPTTPTAQKRKARTRTKRVNNRPALAVSALPPHHLDLRPGAMCLVCPHCTTWCPITGHHGSTPKLVPHHTQPAGEPGKIRCTVGSNRRVTLDLTLHTWQQRIAEAREQLRTRRSNTTERPQPRPRPKAPALSVPHLRADAQTRAHGSLLKHLRACRHCITGQTCEQARTLQAQKVRLTGPVVTTEPTRRDVHRA